MSKPLKNPDNVDLSGPHYRIVESLGVHVVVTVQDFDYDDYNGFSTRRIYAYTNKNFKKASKKASRLNDES